MTGKAFKYPQKENLFWQFQVMFHMFGTYAMYLDIGRDDDDDYMTENLATKIAINNLHKLLCKNYEIRKDSQKYGQHPCKNCEKVHF